MTLLVPITKILSDGRTLTTNPDGTTLLTHLDGGILITTPDGSQRYVSGTNKEAPTQATILSASLNAESEKKRARILFDQERARVDEELRKIRNRSKAKRNFNAVVFIESIVDRMNQGKYI